MTIARVKQHRFALTALLATLAIGAIDLASSLSVSAASVNLHNPVGQLSSLIAGHFSPAPSLTRAGSDRVELTIALFVGIKAALIGLFSILLWIRATARSRASSAIEFAWAGAPILIALALDSLVFNLIAAALLGAMLPVRRGLAWLGGQYLIGAALDALLIALFIKASSDASMTTLLGYFMLERLLLIPAFGLAWLVRQERKTRLALAASHAELLATQALLADAVRSSERSRIARDLHDAVGHHLTALNLHLDLATRQAVGPADAALQTARALARDLLAEVRSVVSAERDEHHIDVRAALIALCSGIPAPAIELAIDDELQIDSPGTAHALFCCVQEAITNAVRHARATLITIEVAIRDAAVVASISDDGCGRRGSEEGNGLAGMRERVAHQGGVMSAQNRPPRGFRVELCMPAAGAAA